MLTRRGTALLAGSAGAWLVARALAIPELYVASAAGAILVGLAALATLLTTTNFTLRRRVSGTRIAADGSAEVELSLRNDVRLPASLLLVEDSCPYALAPPPRFVVPGIAPGQKVTLPYRIEGRYRGRYRVGPLQLRARDALGLTESVSQSNEAVEVVVYPRVEALTAGRSGHSDNGSGSSQASRLFNTGDEFHTMREYVSGDDLRQVHWRSTAHRGTLMIRQLELPWQPEAMILCDTRSAAHDGAGPTSSLERAISAAASLVCHLGDQRYRVRLLTEADRDLPLVQGRQTLLDRLAELEPSKVATLAPAFDRMQGAGRGLLIAVLAPFASGRSRAGRAPLSQELEVQALVTAGRRFSARIAIVIDHAAMPSETDAGQGLATGSPAAQLAGVLAASGWRAGTWRRGESLQSRWRALTDTAAAAQAASVRHAALQKEATARR